MVQALNNNWITYWFNIFIFFKVSLQQFKALMSQCFADNLIAQK